MHRLLRPDASPDMNSVLHAFSLKHNLKQLFVRPASNFKVLDGLRGLSIIMVIFLHSFAIYCGQNPEIPAIEFVDNATWLTAWVWNADKGVDIFFVISGFLITGILLRQLDRTNGIRYGNFYMRRFLRLGPAYWSVILLYLALPGLPNKENLWANFFYVNNFLPYEIQAMNWTWSLAIEEQFYLIYPLILAVIVTKTTRPLTWLWGLFALSFIIRAVVIVTDEKLATTPGSHVVMYPEFHAHHFAVIYDNLYTRYGALLCGCLAAFYYFHHEAELRRFLVSPLGKGLEFLSILIILVLLWLPILSREYDDPLWFSLGYQVFNRNLFSAAVAYMALVCLEKSYLSFVFNAIFSNRIWYPFAQLSYSMYLLHVFPIVIFAYMATQAKKLNPEQFDFTHLQAMGLVAGCSIVASVLGAMVIYLVLERPVMNLRR